jgi:hypothetical protein
MSKRTPARSVRAVRTAPGARGRGWISAAVAALLATLAARAPAEIEWSTPWIEPRDAAAAAERSDEYAWRLFVALDWPADEHARKADPSAAFGADRPVVWETWQNVADVFLDDGRKPAPWAAAEPRVADARRFETGSLKDLANPKHIVNGTMVPLLDPIAGAKRLTEIRMNRVTFDYIRARGLYDQEGQLRAVADGRGVHFPAGATNIKARWRPITDAERSRYHTLAVTLADGSRRLYGLTALHIATKDLGHWFWATFEHEDNPTLADNEGWQLPSRDTFACGGEAADCNGVPRGIGLEDTVWRHYRLRGTLVRFVDARNHPLLLANSELEAGMQRTSSCITCHARASIGIVAGTPTRLPIFESTEMEFPVRRGYVGLPQAQWFGGSEPGAQPLFQQLDFVWSLSKAHSRRGS